MPSVALPSGLQIELRSGEQRAVIVEVGGGLREYTVGGVPVVDGYQQDAMADGGRGQPLLPWPNRLADGQYTWDGWRLQLPIDELARRNASHGLTRWLAWSVARRSATSVTMQQVLHPRPGYPFQLQVEIEYTLMDTGLVVRTTARNVGARALPYGLGFHPYFTAGTATVDESLLRLPAHQVLQVDERMLPTGASQAVSETEFDFTSPRRIGGTQLDGCFTALERDADGVARVALSTPDGRRTVTVWVDRRFKYLQVFSGDTLAPERRRQGLAIEPMTCPPNAFKAGIDVVRLAPEQTHTSTWGVALTTP